MNPSPAVVCGSCQVPAEPEHRYCSEDIGRNGLPRQVALKHMSIPEMRKKFCIPDFLEVHNIRDELTIDMISEFSYSSTKLLIAAGQLEAGLRLPLYDAENPFQYEALASRIPQRGVVQYTGNFYRMLRECILRSKGKTSLPGGSNPCFDSSNYTAENFNNTFVEVRKKMHHSWSVGPHRNLAKNDKRARPLNDADITKITKFLRWDKDHRWYSTPLVISGPWVLGQMPDGSVRTCTDKEYPAYCPWELNLTLLSYKTVSSSLSEKKKRRPVKLIGQENGEKKSGGHEKKRRRVENVNKNSNKQRSRVSEVRTATNVAGSPTVVEARPTEEMDEAMESHQPQMISTPAADNFVEVPSSDDSELEEPVVRINPEERLLNQVQREDRHASPSAVTALTEENASLRAKYDQEVDALKKQLDEMRRRAEKLSADQQADRAAAQTDRTTVIEKLAAANAKIESRELQFHNMESDLNKAEHVIQRKDREIDVLLNRIQGLLPLEQELETADLERKREEKLRLLATKQKEGYMKDVEAQKITITNLEMELAKKEKCCLELRIQLQDSEQARSRAETQVAELRKEREDSKRKLRENIEDCINRSFPRTS